MNTLPVGFNGTNIQMTGGEKQKKKGFLGTIGSAAKDIGLSVAAGSACGLAVGGVASLIPFKNTEGVKQELQDAFIGAAKDGGKKSYMSNPNAKAPLKRAKDVVSTEEAMSKIAKKKALKGAQKALKDAGNDKKAIGEAILKASEEYGIGEYGVKIPELGEKSDLKKVKKALLKQLDGLIDDSVDTSKKAITSIQKKAVKFIEDFDKSIVKYMENAPKDDELLKLAKKEASRVRRSKLISNAVYIGILSMLLMNLFSSFMPKRKAKEGAPAPNAAAPGPASASLTSLKTTQA